MQFEMAPLPYPTVNKGTDKTRILELEGKLTEAEFNASGYQIEIAMLKAEAARLNAINVALITLLVVAAIWIAGTFAA